MKMALLAASLVLARPAMAQDHTAHAMSMTTGNTAASEAFAAANAKMHVDMAVELTGNPALDFIRSMIPHRRGAVEMARIELEHGTDPEVTALAAQEKEIAWMEVWLAKYVG